jgi:hypothetical protein
MAMAMRLLDAGVETVRPDGSARIIPIADFHRLPGNTPHSDNVLDAGELITAVTLPRPQLMNNSVHRPATVQRLRIGATRDGRISATAHERLVRQSAWRQAGNRGRSDQAALRRRKPHDCDAPGCARSARGQLFPRPPPK